VKFAWHFALAWAVAAMGAGIWLGYHAWQVASQPWAMLAVVLLLSAPMLAAAVFLARPDPPPDPGISRSGTFVDSIQRVDGSLRVVRLCRAHLGVAGSFVFVLWFCQLGGYYRLLEFLVFYTLACAAAAAAFLPWLASCERRLYDEREEYWQRLGEVEAGL
jgi:hypothetical protein